MNLVTCGHCGAQVEASKADVTGRGYRCVACSMKASLAADGGRNDVADHLTAEERVAKSEAAAREILVGIGTAIAGLIVFVVVPFPFHDLVGACIGFGGCGAVSHGYLTRREMRGLRTE